jgi:hypothetical protein
MELPRNKSLLATLVHCTQRGQQPIPQIRRRVTAILVIGADLPRTAIRTIRHNSICRFLSYDVTHLPQDLQYPGKLRPLHALGIYKLFIHHNEWSEPRNVIICLLAQLWRPSRAAFPLEKSDLSVDYKSLQPQRHIFWYSSRATSTCLIQSDMSEPLEPPASPVGNHFRMLVVGR